MSELSKNQLVNRRNFIERAADAAKLLGLTCALGKLSQGAKATDNKANPWGYDDSQFRKTDPKLIRYHEIFRIRIQRPSPRCMSLTKDGRLYVGAGKYLSEFTSDGTQAAEIALSDEPRCVAASDDGLLYIGQRDHVEMYDRKGQRRGVWDAPPKNPYLTGIAINDTGVFVADAGNRVVLRYNRSGVLKSRIGEKNKELNIPGFIVPSPFFDVKMGADGLLRVTNPGRHCVEAYTVEGDLESSWGKPGAAIEKFCGCCNPVNLASLADGRTVTFEKGIPRVKVYSNDGVFECVVAGAESFAENAKVCGPSDCTLGGLAGAADARGRIYILDFVAAEVRIMERNPA
jgi:hypothetical protein